MSWEPSICLLGCCCELGLLGRPLLPLGKAALLWQARWVPAFVLEPMPLLSLEHVLEPLARFVLHRGSLCGAFELRRGAALPLCPS